MKKTKVLMLDTSPMLYDGITMVIKNYIANMVRDTVEIDVCAINEVDSNLKKEFTDMGCKFYELTNRNIQQIQYIKDLAALIRREKYEIVHIHCNSCTAAVDLLAAKLGGAKVRAPHSHNTKSAHVRSHKILRPLFNLLYTDAFACGVEAGEWLFGKGKHVTVWKNAINTDNFKFRQEWRLEIRNKYNLGDKIAVGHVAHFTPHKNHKFLIDIWKDVVKRNPNYVLFLIGDGRLRGDVEQQVKEYGLEDNVIFTGLTTEVPQYLSAMDLMVLPSLYEGLPYVVIEWQDAGLPTLVADTVTKECKLTDLLEFVPLDKDAWVDAILNTKILADRVASSAQGIKQITAKGFNIKENSEKLKRYYIDSLKK